MLKYQVDRNVLINIYLSFIRPILEYGNVIWDNCTQNEANLLESVQVEAGRIITGLRVNSSRSKLYSELGWNPFIKEERNTLQDLICSCNGTSPCTKACVCFEENLACTDLCFSAKVRMVQTCTNAYIERRHMSGNWTINVSWNILKLL